MSLAPELDFAGWLCTRDIMCRILDASNGVEKALAFARDGTTRVLLAEASKPRIRAIREIRGRNPRYP